MSKEIRKLAEAALNDIHVKGFRSSIVDTIMSNEIF